MGLFDIWFTSVIFPNFTIRIFQYLPKTEQDEYSNTPWKEEQDHLTLAELKVWFFDTVETVNLVFFFFIWLTDYNDDTIETVLSTRRDNPLIRVLKRRKDQNYGIATVLARFPAVGDTF